MKKIVAFFHWLFTRPGHACEQLELRKARIFTVLMAAFVAILFIYALHQLLARNDTLDTRYLVAAFFVLLVFINVIMASVHRISLLRSKNRSELMEKEERYRSLVENIGETIFTLDTSGYLTYLSPPIERIGKYKIKDLVGQHFSSLVYPGDLPVVEGFIKKLFSGINEMVEFRLIDNENTPVYVRTSGRLITKDGMPIAITGLITDISEKKKVEAQLNQAQKMESVGRLAGAIAHDFNNFLTVIMGYCRMLTVDIPGEHPSGKCIKGIQTAAERAASLTERLLAFSRRQPSEPQVLNINELVASLESMLQSLIGENITLETSLAAGIHAVKIDPLQLEQVIMNLVVNAVDAMPKQGILRIETANIHLDETYCRRVTGTIPGDYVMILVADTGCGMTEETKEFLFEPFFTTKEVGEGTGLGLSTVYGIVKQNGGHTSFESELEKGTIFKIYFPAVAAPVAPAENKGENKAAKTANMTVNPGAPGDTGEVLLVVEDEADLRDVIINILQDQGYRTYDAGTGEEALELCGRLQGENVDLLITDVVMPGMNGKELADELVRLFPDSKVLFISGYTGKRIVTHEILSRGLSFLAKPFSPLELLQKIRQILDSKKCT